MALQRVIWHSTLLCIVQVCSMPTKCKLQRRLVETCYHLLETMGGTFPLQCLEDNVLVTFPTGVFKSSTRQQTTATEKSIYTTLKYIDSMFDTDRVPDQWAAQEKLDHFQHIIFRLIEENRCIMGKTQESLDDFISREASLRAYFDKIATVLKEKGFQYCAWEFVRNEILRALQFILKEDFHSMWPRRDPGTKHESLK
ncbi:interferon alpha-7-like [Colossoma macropomum]|uniref:interferon alpha-7-like n=1 Tax=Colossoma macropomum TaxID=42526 RepID=UPI0018644733|nr:interferon alpha-7-like [Colossoma macropomum]